MPELQAHWEARLKAEGLEPIDRHYTNKSSDVCYAMPDRVNYGIHSQALVFEFFRMCQEFSRTKKVRWPDVWSPFSKGMSYAAIAKHTGLSRPGVQYRVEKMRDEMRIHFSSIKTEQLEAIPLEAEILEIFVEQQNRK